jgi:hypothetical protein
MSDKSSGVQMGRKAVPCTCDALRDQVSIDMALFGDANALSVDSQSVSHETSSDEDESDDAAASQQGTTSPSDVSETDVVNAAVKLAGKRARTPQPAGGSAKASRSAAGGAVAASPTAAASAAAAAAMGRGGADRRARASRGVPPARTSTTSIAAAKPLRAAALKLNVARKQCSRNGVIAAQLAELAKPAAVVYGGSPKGSVAAGARVFDLVVPLDRPASCKKKVLLQYLREGRDGLYRPSSEVTEELRSSLVPIRTQILDPGARKPGFKLLTLRSRILGTELR